MTARARKKPTAAATVSEIRTWPRTDGAEVHAFVVDGIKIELVAPGAAQFAAAAALASQLHAICSIPPAPPRIEAWGPGQFDRVTLAPGVEAWLRVTPEGRVRMVVSGGDLDVTAGSAALGTGLHEAGARAAQIRERIKERTLRLEQRKPSGAVRARRAR